MQKIADSTQPQFWRDHIEKFIVSHKNQKEYCIHNNLGYYKFKRWRYKFANEFPLKKNQIKVKLDNKKPKIKADKNTTIANKFVPVTVTNFNFDDQNNLQPIKLYLNGNMYLELPSALDVKIIHKIFNALGVL